MAVGRLGEESIALIFEGLSPLFAQAGSTIRPGSLAIVAMKALVREPDVVFSKRASYALCVANWTSGL